jgi:hypothetical protein
MNNEAEWQDLSDSNLSDNGRFLGNNGGISLTEGIYTNDSELLAPNEDVGNLSANAAELLSALLRGMTVRDASRLAGISERQAYRYLNEPAFQAELSSAKRRLLQATETRLLALSEKVITKLESIIDDEKTSAASAIRACAILMDHSLRHNEIVSLEASMYWLQRVQNDTEY